MKVQEFPYQTNAADQVTLFLSRAKEDFDRNCSYSAISLTAPTAAGKTVISASVFERIFYGDAFRAADPNATVLWFSDSPSLNEQTRRSFLETSSRLTASDLIMVDLFFDQEYFLPGKIYFVNTQKLRDGGNLKKGNSDRRRYSVLDTIANTRNKFGASFILAVDEAHRGTGSADSSKSTILSRIIGDGEAGVPAAPVVLGISATPQRFEKAMSKANKPARSIIQVQVPVQEVRESGLIKDQINIFNPDESQPASITMVTAAAARRLSYEQRWAEACKIMECAPVVPALVVQLNDKTSDEELRKIIAAIREADPSITSQNIAHCLQEHTSLQGIDSSSIRYVAPADIQQESHIKVVLFKQALTTGWNCPRAEVMVSMRPAVDITYITQLIGRMVRTPLAQRITVDESLNAVDLMLPYYDAPAVTKVVDALTTGDDAIAIEVSRGATVELPKNPNLPQEVFDAVATVPTFTAPSRMHSSQVTRAHRLAHQLEADGIIEGAQKQMDDYLYGVFGLEWNALGTAVTDALIDDVLKLNIVATTLDVRRSEQAAQAITLDAAGNDIRTAFENAKRSFRDGLAMAIWNRLCDEQEAAGNMDFHPDEAKVIVAAAASQPQISLAIENAAENKVRAWFQQYDASIRQTSRASHDKYEQIRAMSREPEATSIMFPATAAATSDSQADKFAKHLFAVSEGSDAGLYPAVLNTWEKNVVTSELADLHTRAWYRNPTGGTRSCRIPYKDGDVDKSFYPDFIFVHEIGNDLLPSIVDPHNYAMADTGPKWRALADYAETHGAEFHRIDAVISNPAGDTLRLDLKDATCRKALRAAGDSKEAILAVFERHGGVY